MEQLISAEEILKLGYKPESQVTLSKKSKVGVGVERFIKCSSCGCFFHTKKQLDNVGKLKEDCFWCGNTINLKLSKK